MGCWLCASCGVHTPRPVEGPKDAPAAMLIPVDLDVVLRVDLQRMRDGIGDALQQEIIDSWQKTNADPQGVMASALRLANVAWLGFRPSTDPRSWDYVLVLEGELADLDASALETAFKPPRPLGDGYLVYDAWQEPHRLSAARLYVYRTSKLIFASSAEVDAVERVVEQGRYERHTELPARGLLSFSTPTRPIAEELRDGSPRFARFLSDAHQLSGFVDISARGLLLEARLAFGDAEQAARAARAMQIVGDALQTSSSSRSGTEGSTCRVESVTSEVTLSATFSLELLAELLTLR